VQGDAPVRMRRSGRLLRPLVDTWRRLGRPTWRWASWLVFVLPLGQIATLLWVIWTHTANVRTC
jgi:hypothetical protein